MGAIPIHAWHSRVANLEHPDWCVLDLDPKSAPFADVVQVAREIRELLEEVELPGFLKTSGASGLHILLPLANQLTHDQSRTLGELLARVIVARRGDISTVARAVRAREDKVYIDFMQNGHGHLLVLPFSRTRRTGGVGVDAAGLGRTRRRTQQCAASHRKRARADARAGRSDAPSLGHGAGSGASAGTSRQALAGSRTLGAGLWSSHPAQDAVSLTRREHAIGPASAWAAGGLSGGGHSALPRAARRGPAHACPQMCAPVGAWEGRMPSPRGTRLRAKSSKHQHVA